MGFKYEFELVPDNMYGSYNKETKKWNGLVKHLLDRVRQTPQSLARAHESKLYQTEYKFEIIPLLQKADLAICDLTITYSRRTAVDFTMPFMTLGGF